MHRRARLAHALLQQSLNAALQLRRRKHVVTRALAFLLQPRGVARTAWPADARVHAVALALALADARQLTKAPEAHDGAFNAAEQTPHQCTQLICRRVLAQVLHQHALFFVRCVS